MPGDLLSAVLLVRTHFQEGTGCAAIAPCCAKTVYGPPAAPVIRPIHMLVCMQG